MIPYTLNENGITFFYKGRQRVIAKDNPNVENIIAAVISDEPEKLDVFLEVRKFVSKISYGNVSIDSDDMVRFKGEQVPEYLAHRIIAHHSEGWPIEPLCNFAAKLMLNPNNFVKEDLYKWLERGNMPIYPDGDFAGYKLVRTDFSPIHQGPYGKDQSPGTTVSMPRGECDSNRDHTCAEGLHFCSYEYLPIFQDWNRNAGQKVILLKINPMNVVSIPTDYNLTKGRTCEFYVVSEIDPQSIKEDFGDKLVLSGIVTEEEEEETVTEEKEKKMVKHDFAYSYREVNDAISEAGGNKTEAARRLGISRSTLYKILNNPTEDDTKDPRRVQAENAMSKWNYVKTHAAEALGISRSTLSKWLNL